MHFHSDTDGAKDHGLRDDDYQTDENLFIDLDSDWAASLFID